MLCDPGHVGRDARVDPRQVTQGTAVAPADYSRQTPGAAHPADQRATGVTLREERGAEHGRWAAEARWGQRRDGTHVAGVPALTSGAQHVMLDKTAVIRDVPGGLAVVLVADLVFHQLYIHLLQTVGRRQ